jgi:fused signal recognition particle receptor
MAFNLGERLKKIFGLHDRTGDDFFDDLADSLIEGDIGPRLAFDTVEMLRKNCAASGAVSAEAVQKELIGILSQYARGIELRPEPGKVSIFLTLGVNGVGKTTSVAKMAVWYRGRGCPNIVLAAADTFRAAAIEQLQYHGKAAGFRVVAHQSGSDPGAVIFDAAEAVRATGGGLVIADTAGRLHNKENLVRELQKIDRIAASKADPGCYRKLLVLDSTTGQNGLRQAETFHEAVGLDAIILTKYDSTARGGIALSCGKELGLPVAFVGTGEKYADFGAFDKDAYLSDFSGAGAV